MTDPEVKARLDEYNTWFPKPVPRYPTCFCERCRKPREADGNTL
jgi:hypothetical protein